ncbi:Cytochrome c biogenesis protein CcsB [Arcanobacterium haemolyticum]|uniref:cytochrome c biogenesis protein ResB n=1 Tax=Arcanobacterium haemolyticum TaxID=28264 RepID=UPI000D99CAF4|nr:cytochrome c biogenesis protein ResB [Arcanobacterium haemolyticum]SPT74339.1 Cytochrome c biogenesis protein CcsB [Arcanobacterium haemolyticum]
MADVVETSDELDSVNLSLSQIVKMIYAFFYNKKIGMLLILLVGLLSMIGVIMPQVSNEVRDDPQAWGAFLERVSDVYGGWTDILGALGFFSIFTSWVFLGSMLLLCLSIIGCTVHRLPVLYKAAFHPHVKVRDSFFERARLRTEFKTIASDDDVVAALRTQTKRWHGRVLVDDQTNEQRFYVDRFRWAPFGTAFSHAAFVIIICGFLVSSFTGFRDESFTLTVGYEKPVGHDTGLVAKAESFKDTYYENGKPKDYVTDLVVSKNGKRLARQEVRVNSPLTVDGVTFHQASFGLASVVSIADASGSEIFANGVPLTKSTADGRYTYGVVNLPEQKRDVYVVAVASGQQAVDIKPGQMRIEVYPEGSNKPENQQVVNQGEPVKIGDLTYTFIREAQYAGITVKNDPGTTVVWIGCALIAFGTTVTMLLRHHRLWVRVVPEGSGSRVQFASHDKAELGFERQFKEFAEKVITIAEKKKEDARA